MNFPANVADNFRKSSREIQWKSVKLYYTKKISATQQNEVPVQAYAYELRSVTNIERSKLFEKLQEIEVFLRSKEIAWANDFLAYDGLKNLLFIFNLFNAKPS